MPYTNQVYDRAMARTNIDLDDRLIQLVMRRFGVKTKREAVDLALRRLVGEPMTPEEILSYRGAHLIEVNVRELSRGDR